MAVNPSLAVEAYQRALRQGTGAAGAGASGEMPGADFGALLGDVLQTAAQAAKAGEAGIAAGAAGTASLVDVVTAVSAAEIALETVVTVRDRVIAAYQDIMKMPI